MKRINNILNTKTVVTFFIGFPAGLLFGYGFSFMPLVFNLYTIDWNGIAAIATFCAVAFAFYEYRISQKREAMRERKTAWEKILQPLMIDLQDIIRAVPEGESSQFRLEVVKRVDYYLFLGLEPSLQKAIEKFYQDYKSLERRYPRFLTNISDSSYQAVIAYLDSRTEIIKSMFAT